MKPDSIPPTPTPGPEGTRTRDVQSILRRLGRLRVRVRAIFATIGLSRWLVGAVAVLAVFFLADWLLDLPLGVRRFVRLGLLHPPAALHVLVLVPLLAISAFLAIAFTRRGHGAAPLFSFVAGGAVGLLLWLSVRLFVPLRVRLPDQELALSVEARFRHLRDRLAAALDFERELRNPTRGESATMMAAVVHQAADEVRDLRFSRAVSGRRALRWGGGALLSLACAAAFNAAFSQEIGLWARRSLLLQDISWPRATTMLAVDARPDGTFRPHDPGTPYEVPIGRSLTVYARAEGEAPDGASVLDLVPGQAPLARRMFTVPGREDVFAYEFLDVRRPFAFIVHGGDDDDETPRYQVEITIPPRVLSVRSTITFPDYLDRGPEEVADGTVSVPQGSKVDVTFTTDLPIAHAEAVLGDETIPAEAIGDAAGSEPGARAFRFAYTAERSVHGRLLLRTPDGKENDPASDSFEVRVKSDQPPRLDWIWPQSSLEVTPGGRVPLLAQCSDDHGVRELVLEVRINAEDPQRHPLTPHDPAAGSTAGELRADATDGEFGRRRVLAYVPVEIADLRHRQTPGGEPKPDADLALVPQDAVSFRLSAMDSRGQARESEWIRVDVGAPGSLERGLATQRSNVRLALEAVRREQAARREDVLSVLAAPLESAELDLVKSVRFAQGRIAQDADRAVQELIGVFNAFIYDRLGAQNPNAKILGYLDRHHRATYGLPRDRSDEPPVRAPVAQGDWKGNPIFPYALYDEIIVAWRGKVIYDKGLIDKMSGALAEAVEVGARLAPRAHRAAAIAVSGEKDQVRALLVAQDENLAALDRLLESMRGWQSLHEMKLWLRQLIDEQKVIIRQMEGGDEKADKKDNGVRRK